MLSQTDRPAQTPETSDTDTTSSANEITPLRRSQDAIAGDTPSLVTIRSSKRSHKMDNNKRILFKLAIDFFLLCCGEFIMVFCCGYCVGRFVLKSAVFHSPNIIYCSLSYLCGLFYMWKKLFYSINYNLVKKNKIQDVKSSCYP